MYVDSRDFYSECNLRTTCAVAPLYLLTELILTYFRLTSFAIYQSRWFQCELLSCGDKRLQDVSIIEKDGKGSNHIIAQKEATPLKGLCVTISCNSNVLITFYSPYVNGL